MKLLLLNDASMFGGRTQIMYAIWGDVEAILLS